MASLALVNKQVWVTQLFLALDKYFWRQQVYQDSE